MILHANCKINLGLDILRRREDGFHDLETVMIPVSGLFDVIEVEKVNGLSTFEQRGLVVDCDVESNLCMKALRLMQRLYGVGEAKITLDKRVPFGAGLGGGSSDATAVIVAINEIYNLELDNPTLASLAAELGSDTPFFVYNRAMLCKGRGEVMEQIDVDLSGLWLVVAKPESGVSTAEAYRGVRPSTPETPLTELLKRPIEEWQGSVVNDFEPHILSAHKDIADIKSSLIDAGALYASMSGSGSAVFALFGDEPKLTLPTDIFVHVERI